MAALSSGLKETSRFLSYEFDVPIPGREGDTGAAELSGSADPAHRQLQHSSLATEIVWLLPRLRGGREPPLTAPVFLVENQIWKRLHKAESHPFPAFPSSASAGFPRSSDAPPTLWTFAHACLFSRNTPLPPPAE
jgi:hypothetical protein